MRVLVIDKDRLYAVKPDREIVVRPLMRLEQSDVDVEVRRHFRSHLEGVGHIALSRGLDPFP